MSVNCCIPPPTKPPGSEIGLPVYQRLSIALMLNPARICEQASKPLPCCLADFLEPKCLQRRIFVRMMLRNGSPRAAGIYARARSSPASEVSAGFCVGIRRLRFAPSSIMRGKRRIDVTSIFDCGKKRYSTRTAAEEAADRQMNLRGGPVGKARLAGLRVP